ncbi:MAG: formylglycine-generating enzyme family protein [Tildeniella torsiva UHER 1998/13D]|jgi:formylglycine-generating enzyme required for sulfatase activity|nr:formylglycine-generating enzyme family protein [Tildeniella torsiva UHER 1998/13D]
MTDPAKRSRLFRLIAQLPLAQFEELIFATQPPPGNVSPGSAAQALRVGELLVWAESPIGCGLETLAKLTADIFGLEVPDFSQDGGQQAHGSSSPTSPEPGQAVSFVDTEPSAYIETLNRNVGLDMVYVPGGTFWMGSPKKELGRDSHEGPEHRVSVPAFYMGKYPVTQAQWYAVSLLEPVQRELKPQPSHFTGDRHPVEQVSWDDAVEFCERVSRLAGKQYRLPSEAEWEYACRAGTNMPFYFGATITPDLANYDGSQSYGDGPTGIYREQTTEVGQFPPNDFGLYDMHGNVCEWCQDVWHGSYDGAPTNGSAWRAGGDQDRRILRGGSWYDNPEDCRSADRDGFAPDGIGSVVGFRVVCGGAIGLA